MRSTFLPVFAAALLGLVVCSAEEPEDATKRAERLEALLRSVLASDAARPSVLAGYNPRTADPATRKAARAIVGTTLDVHFENQPLEEVLALFQKVAGVPFVLSAKAREVVAATKPKVTLALEGLTLLNLLNLLVDHVPDLRFRLHEGAVQCVTREEHRPALELRVIDVRDIVRPRPDFPAPPLGLGEGREKAR